MLRTLDNMLGYRLAAADGEIGKVHDFFVDDSLWRLRYLVIDTGSWLNRRRVLVAPAALGTIDGEHRQFCVKLTRDQIAKSPDVDTEKPVSRQEEIGMNAHYGWPAYWAPEAITVPAPPLAAVLRRDAQLAGDPHLRSFREISSYGVNHAGEYIARAQDFVIDDSDWSLTNMVIVLGGWLDSRLVAVPVDSITAVSWTLRMMTVDLPKTTLETLPVFEIHAPVNREARIEYFDYYGRPAPVETPEDPPR